MMMALKLPANLQSNPIVPVHLSSSAFTCRNSGPLYGPRGADQSVVVELFDDVALHPLTRDMAKIGVYNGTSRPIA